MCSGINFGGLGKPLTVQTTHIVYDRCKLYSVLRVKRMKCDLGRLTNHGSETNTNEASINPGMEVGDPVTSVQARQGTGLKLCARGTSV